MSAVDVCSDYSPHNKFSWEDGVRGRLPEEGPIIAQTFALASLIRASVGTANDHTSHVNVCWRTSASLTDAMGWSADTYRRHRDVLEEEGFLFTIASGRGPQKILILKHPEHSKADALETAIGSLSAYRDRTDNPRLNWVFEALRCAYAKHRSPRSESPPSSPPEPDGPDQIQGSRRADANNSHAPPLYMKRQQSDVCSSRQSDGNKPSSDNPPPTTHQKPSRSETPDIVDFQHIRTFREQWRKLFKSFGRNLDEGCALKLARAYVEEVGDADRLADGHFRTPSGGLEDVEERLARLFGDGTSTGRVASYLLEDVESFSVPDRPPKEPRQGSDESTTSSPNDASGSSASQFPEYTRRVGELEYAGYEYEEALAKARLEAEEKGWAVPEPIEE